MRKQQPCALTQKKITSQNDKKQINVLCFPLSCKEIFEDLAKDFFEQRKEQFLPEPEIYTLEENDKLYVKLVSMFSQKAVLAKFVRGKIVNFYSDYGQPRSTVKLDLHKIEWYTQEYNHSGLVVRLSDRIVKMPFDQVADLNMSKFDAVLSNAFTVNHTSFSSDKFKRLTYDKLGINNEVKNTLVRDIFDLKDVFMMTYADCTHGRYLSSYNANKIGRQSVKTTAERIVAYLREQPLKTSINWDTAYNEFLQFAEKLETTHRIYAKARQVVIASSTVHAEDVGFVCSLVDYWLYCKNVRGIKQIKMVQGVVYSTQLVYAQRVCVERKKSTVRCYFKSIDGTYLIIDNFAMPMTSTISNKIVNLRAIEPGLLTYEINKY